MNCTYCGNPLEENAAICTSCGKSVKAPKKREYKDRRICSVMGFIFGILGLVSFPFILFSALSAVLSALGIRSTKSELSKVGLFLSILSLLAAFFMYIYIIATNNITNLAAYIFDNFLI